MNSARGLRHLNLEEEPTTSRRPGRQRPSASQRRRRGPRAGEKTQTGPTVLLWTRNSGRRPSTSTTQSTPLVWSVEQRLPGTGTPKEQRRHFGSRSTKKTRRGKFSFLFFYTLKLVYLCPLLVDTPRRESSHLRRVVGEKDPFTQSLPSHVGVGDVPNDFSLYTWTWVHSDPTLDLRRKEAHWDYDDRPRGP